MKKSLMVTPRLPEAKAAFSRGTKVELDSVILMFISGTASVDAQGKTAHVGDFHAQVMHTYKNIVSILERENAGLKDVVKFTVFLKNMDDYDRFNKARDEFFEKSGLKREEFPASTCVEARLCREDLLVEIEAVAIVQKIKFFQGKQ
ncbi:MAG: RidA family protein [Candidatus Omnitrophota bacterium]|nr:RidA family protein [Candidatus Omnitrophota bacterium]